MSRDDCWTVSVVVMLALFVAEVTIAEQRRRELAWCHTNQEAAEDRASYFLRLHLTDPSWQEGQVTVFPRDAYDCAKDRQGRWQCGPVPYRRDGGT